MCVNRTGLDIRTGSRRFAVEHLFIDLSDKLKERTKRNEKIVSALEEKIGGDISEDMINRFVEFQKMNSENNNSEIEKYQNENCNTDKTDSYY